MTEQNRIEELEKALIDDATGLWTVTNAIKKEITSREWILEGRGCYAWDDERYKDETRLAFEAVMDLIRNVQHPAQLRFDEVIRKSKPNQQPISYSLLLSDEEINNFINKFWWILDKRHGDKIKIVDLKYLFLEIAKAQLAKCQEYYYERIGYLQYKVESIRQETLREVTNVYDEYIELLGDELDEISGLAIAHGWKSSRYEAGVECRKKIANLKEGRLE